MERVARDESTGVARLDHWHDLLRVRVSVGARVGVRVRVRVRVRFKANPDPNTNPSGHDRRGT